VSRFIGYISSLFVFGFCYHITGGPSCMLARAHPRHQARAAAGEPAQPGAAGRIGGLSPYPQKKRSATKRDFDNDND